MTTAGWLIMIVSVGTVSALFLWCIRKLLSLPPEADRRRGFEIEPPDQEHAEDNPKVSRQRRTRVSRTGG